MTLNRLSFLRRPRDRWALLAFLVVAMASVLVGFVLVKPATTERLIVKGGYFYILGVFALFVIQGWRVMASRRTAWIDAVRRPGWVGVFLIVATAFTVWADSFAHKVLFDEYVSQGTAWHMHLTKEIGTPVRAYDIQGTWLVIDTFLDKRPYFFPFLISLLHDLTGFRVVNVFVLNVLLAFVLLGTTYALVRALTSRMAPALVAVGLLATLPLLTQNVTGGNMEVLNLTMIAVTMGAALLYLRAPDADRLSLLVLAAVLLAQTRYESVLYILPVAVVVVLGWMRADRVILSWPAMAAPLLLVPYLWHDRFVASNPVLWQLHADDVSRFAWRYLPGNLEGARNLFFSVSALQPNSLWLVILGLGGLAWGSWRTWARRLAHWQARSESRPLVAPAVSVLVLFAATIAGNLGLLMFYYWGRLDDPVAARLSLPAFFLLALAAGGLVHSLDQRRMPGTAIAAYGLAAWFLVAGTGAYANRLYTKLNLVMHEVNWELAQANVQAKPLLWITTKATLPFLLDRIPALNAAAAVGRAPQIAWHLREGTFRDVFVSQVLRPMSAEGEPMVDPEDELPASFHLRTVSQKRFGARWVRISRLEEIAGEPPVADAAAVPAPPAAPR